MASAGSPGERTDEMCATICFISSNFFCAFIDSSLARFPSFAGASNLFFVQPLGDVIGAADVCAFDTVRWDSLPLSRQIIYFIL